MPTQEGRGQVPHVPPIKEQLQQVISNIQTLANENQNLVSRIADVGFGLDVHNIERIDPPEDSVGVFRAFHYDLNTISRRVEFVNTYLRKLAIDCGIEEAGFDQVTMPEDDGAMMERYR